MREVKLENGKKNEQMQMSLCEYESKILNEQVALEEYAKETGGKKADLQIKVVDYNSACVFSVFFTSYPF